MGRGPAGQVDPEHLHEQVVSVLELGREAGTEPAHKDLGRGAVSAALAFGRIFHWLVDTILTPLRKTNNYVITTVGQHWL